MYQNNQIPKGGLSKMKTYLIPVTNSYEYDYCNYVIVKSETASDAYHAALNISEVKDYDRLVDDDLSHYKIFDGNLKSPKEFFYESEKDDITSLLLDQCQITTKNKEDIMSDYLYDLVYMKDYNQNIEDLIKKILPEQWSFPGKSDNSILKNYLSCTLERLRDEDKIIYTDTYMAFNTGLFDQNYESIYFVAEKTKNENIKKEWVFKEFCTEYGLDALDLSSLPERADYFKDPSLLIFDWRYPVRVQYSHILDGHKERLPKSISESKLKLQLLTGVIDTSIKKVIANYKLAVPQNYDGKIQLLLPLFFENDDKPDLALAVTKKNDYYQGHTCLTLDMAYNNARLIAKPESTWLNL